VKPEDMRGAMGEEWFAKAKLREAEAQVSALKSDNDTLRAKLDEARAALEPFAMAATRKPIMAGRGENTHDRKGTTYEFRRHPVGTNLLDATQAEAMVRYMVEGLSGGELTDEAVPGWRLVPVKLTKEMTLAVNRDYAKHHGGDVGYSYYPGIMDVIRDAWPILLATAPAPEPLAQPTPEWDQEATA
jgi:hypothetical protein